MEYELVVYLENITKQLDKIITHIERKTGGKKIDELPPLNPPPPPPPRETSL